MGGFDVELIGAGDWPTTDGLDVNVLEWKDGRPISILIQNREGISGGDLRRIKLGSMISARGVDPVLDRERFVRPKKRLLGLGADEFYRSVAVAYTDAVARQQRPRVVMAAESGIPRHTIARWIKEARRRGFLPPASPGRVSA